MAIQEQEEEDNIEALALSRLKRTEEAGPSGTKQEMHLMLMGSLNMLKQQIQSMRAIAKIKEEIKLNLQKQASSLKSLTTTPIDNIQELQFALAIRESLIEKEYEKNKIVYAQNMELQKKLDIAAKEVEVNEAQLQRLQTTLRIANARRSQAEDTLQELLSDPLNISTPSSLDKKWK